MNHDLGFNKEGHPIVARGIAEDNSGMVTELPGPAFKVSCTYPIDAHYDPDTGEETLIYSRIYTDRQEAVKALYDLVGFGRSYGN